MTVVAVLGVELAEEFAADLRRAGLLAVVDYGTGAPWLKVRGPVGSEALFPLVDEPYKRPWHVETLHQTAVCLTEIMTVLEATEPYPRRDSRLFDLAELARENVDELLVSGLPDPSNYRVGDRFVLQDQDSGRFYSATVDRVSRGNDDSELIDVLAGGARSTHTPFDLDYLRSQAAGPDVAGN